jgi:hypothetical protein
MKINIKDEQEYLDFITNSDTYRPHTYNPPDLINHPPHYTAHPSGIECIDVVEHMGFNLGNAVKYIWRADLKHETPIEDLKKAQFYINRELAKREKT